MSLQAAGPLPLAPGLPTSEPEAPLVLLVEDDALMARAAEEVLVRAGCRAERVASGAEALAWLASHRARLVVADYRLEDMTAEDLARHAALPPFLVITGAGSEQVAVAMMKLGARDYLVKGPGFLEALPKAAARVLRDLEVEDRLREAEGRNRDIQDRLRMVLEGSQDGFWDADLETGTAFLSDRGWSLLGQVPGSFPLDRSGLLGRIHPEDRDRALEAVAQHLAGGSPAIEEMVRVGEGQAWRWVLVRGRAVATDGSGRRLRLAGTLSDATERKDAEEREFRHRKAESLGLMAGGIAHDFNNLFQTLTSNLELMGPRFAGDARGRAVLDRCFSILAKASALSRRMLDYSGGSLRSEVLLDLGSLVRQEVASLAQRLHGEAPGVEVVCTLAPQLPRVAGDPGLLAQVVESLVHNAAEALQGGSGRVEVDLAVWQPGAAPLPATGWVGVPQEDPALCLTVSDTGTGIPTEHLARVFDPFFSTKAHGRGLGLPASLGIIRSHGGRIHLDSAPGRGTRFRVFLPLAADPAEASAPAPAGAPEAGRRILLVDDEDDLRESLAEILSDILGFQVVQARDGVEAVERFQEAGADFALVIMDVTMPRMSGTQAWGEIRRLAPSARGILCSGYSEETGLQLASGHGFLGFLKKPFNLQTLQETVTRALAEPLP